MADITVENLSITRGRICETFYCSICSAPPEYCEYFAKGDECRISLLSTNPELFAKLYSADPNIAENKVSNLAVKASANEGEAKVKKPKKELKITITTLERTKRKRITQIRGLEIYKIDLKKASKMFASRFAASSSVSKIPSGGEEILVQGDCAGEILEYIIDQFGLSSNNLEILDPPKKKKA